jgi:hypothetical protein
MTHKITQTNDRSFGFVFAAFFSLGALFPVLSSRAPRFWALGIAAAFLVAALARPALLAPFNKAWMSFGALMNKIVSPIALGIVFYAVVVPTGLILRMLGKESLCLRKDQEAKTYWISRDPQEQSSDSFKLPF